MKKTLTIVMAMVLVAAVAITGTLAYMSAQADPVTNTFKFGNMEIKLDESKVDENGQIITGEGAQRVVENEYKVAPGATVDKDPTVHVKKDSEKCYVYVSIENQLVLNGKEVANYNVDTTKWIPVGKSGNTTVYRYFQEVNASEAVGEYLDLEPVFTKVSFDGEDLTLESIKTINDSNNKIVINAYAHQSENVELTKANDAALEHFKVTAIGA